jgi:signal transduction histidine kinase
VRPGLRRRIAVGSILWTGGMIVLASAVFSVLIERYPHARLALVAHVHGGLQAPLVVGVAIGCMVAGALLVRRGLDRIADLQSRLAELHRGQGRRLDGDYPAEVQPLVNDLNALLDHHDEAVRRAVAKAGDLAHGLKTPLAVLAQEAASADAAGHADLAASIREQVDRMRRQVDYHLAHARAAAAGATPGTRASIGESAEGLARAMLRLHADRGIRIDVAVPEDAAVRAQREDLDEMLGNLLDNACTWARTRVRVACVSAGGDLVVTVDDDGAGLPDDMWSAVLQRGVRADEATAGTGLGLAIVRDLAELYGGSIALEPSPDGGCRARLRLPLAAAPAAGGPPPLRPAPPPA